MILAFKLADIVQVPFGWLISVLYNLTSSYGWALIIFAFLVKLILMPATAKGKKSTMKMSRLTPQVKELQDKYADDPQKQSQALRDLYKAEGVSMGGSCLWSFLPLLILFPLYSVVRQPITYMLQESAEVAEQIVALMAKELPDVFAGSGDFYSQMLAAPRIPEFLDKIREAGIAIKETSQAGVNFTFLGVDLAATPQYNVFAATWKWDWAHLGAMLFPVLSAGSQLLSMVLANKMNNSLVTNEKGVQDKDAVKDSQAAQQSKMMMWVGPIMSLWIGFSMPAALSLYWFAQGIASTISDVYLTQKYRKIYDAEDAERLKKFMAEEAVEAEKERIRAERRAANPDGITTNTSKKKMQAAKQKEEEAAKAAAAKEYAMKKGVVAEEVEEEKDTSLSGIPARPYCKGRAYDPNRYNNQSTEE